MSEPFIGEIRAFSFNYAPKGWAMCNGQLLPINQNQALFALLGTTYGGDGRTTFSLPNLQGRVPLHFSQAIPQGATGGELAHTLTLSEMPAHTHVLQASPAVGTANVPTNTSMLSRRAAEIYHDPVDLTPMGPSTVGPAGSGQAHSNLQPYLVLNFCMALQGLFPSRN
ncbi:MAG: phage tail protein [Verrucomicrobia bacterium]|nr:phage tail protein [Verrucomicrobiota bacterium]MBI3868730.1 phage tail protein [Verrucomicrobiota bacterium]